MLFQRAHVKYDPRRLFENFNFKIRKKGVTSGGSRLGFYFKRKLPLNVLDKNLWTMKPSSAGRLITGRVGVFTKSSRIHRARITNVNYTFRLRFVSFIANILILPFTHKIISMLFLSTGSVTYLPTSHYHKLFTLLRMYTLNSPTDDYLINLNFLGSKIFIKQGFFIIKQLKRNQPISLLEVTPASGIKYARSPSVFAFGLKTNHKLNTMLIRLPSGVRKVFSLLSLGSPGPNPLTGNRY